MLLSFATWSEALLDSLSGLNVWVAIGILVLIALSVILMVALKKKKLQFDVKKLTLGACCVGTGYLLSFLKLYELPFGGSITLMSMLPLLVYGYLYGPMWGTIAGLVYFLLQCTQELYFLTPLQFAFDYILPFTLLGTCSGLLRTKNENFNLFGGFSIAVLARYACHVFAGAVFWGEYAADYGFSSPLLYSIVYNSFVLIDALPCYIIIAVPRLRSLLRSLRPARKTHHAES